MSFTDPCLGPSGVGVLDEKGNLTSAARDSFTAQVILLLTTGNASGKGAKVSSMFDVPFPPIPGPKVFDPDRLLTHPTDPLGDFFWFDPSPFAPLTYDVLRDPDGFYQKRIVSTVYQAIMGVMNVAGTAIAPLIIDYSGLLPPDISVKIKLPDLPKIAAAVPNIPALKALGIDLGDIPKFVANLTAIVPTPSIPSLPTIPTPDFDFDVFPDLFAGLAKIPIKLLPELIGKFSPIDLLNIKMPPFEMFNIVVPPYLDLIVSLLLEVGLVAILPKLLVATIVVILQNAVIALIAMLISQIIGTGIVVKTVGQVFGLA
jgi:hypothetical protein